MNDTVQDRVGEGRIADQVVPTIHGNLAGDQCGAAAVALFDDRQQIVPLFGGEPEARKAAPNSVRCDGTHRAAVPALVAGMDGLG